jgi:hypothetical protein
MLTVIIHFLHLFALGYIAKYMTNKITCPKIYMCIYMYVRYINFEFVTKISLYFRFKKSESSPPCRNIYLAGTFTAQHSAPIAVNHTQSQFKG